MRVTANGEGVVWHAGTELLRELACSSGLVDEAASALAAPGFSSFHTPTRSLSGVVVVRLGLLGP